MVASMTAYGREKVSANWGETICEIRTLNHNYLDLTIQLPDRFGALETPIRKKIKDRLERGKIYCNIHCSMNNSKFAINDALVHQIIDTVESISKKTSAPTYISLLDILSWPGMIIGDELGLKKGVKTSLLALVDKTLDKVLSARNREGGEIKNLIKQRCKLSIEKITQIQKELPALKKKQRKKLMDESSKLKGESDHEKTEQKDVTEELERIKIHAQAVDRVLGQPGAQGYRLDFLMQELKREANTLCAKSTHISITNTAIELKVLIEQMREQIQNIE